MNILTTNNMLSQIPKNIKQTSKRLINQTSLSNVRPNLNNKRISYSKFVV